MSKINYVGSRPPITIRSLATRTFPQPNMDKFLIFFLNNQCAIDFSVQFVLEEIRLKIAITLSVGAQPISFPTSST